MLPRCFAMLIPFYESVVSRVVFLEKNTRSKRSIVPLATMD